MATDYGTFFWGSGFGSGGGGGGSGGGALAAGTAAINNGVSSIDVTYDTTLSSSIPPVVSFVDITDSTPIFLEGYVSAYSTTGFTFTFNAPTDSANYVLNYAVFGAV